MAFLRCLGWLLIAIVLIEPTAYAGSFVTFESGQVRPLAMSPDGAKLYAVNTPDNRLEIFAVARDGLRHVASVPVGLEPVAVAARTNDEVWVVNHLSDSVSVVEVGPQPRVVRTLLVGDEPNDIVFAGEDGRRAFVSTAHRGQNSPYLRGEFETEGIGRADVWVFDSRDLGNSLGGDAETIVTLFGDSPRALAVSPDRKRVYAAVYLSGNRTTSIHEGAVCDGGINAEPCLLDMGMAPGGLPEPNTNWAGDPAPEVGLIVKFDPAAGAAGEWQDELGRNWNDAVRFELPDYDVFEIDALAPVPQAVRQFSGVGTILFNLAVNPVNGKIYVSNTDAHNRVRFEGPGIFAEQFKHPDEPLSVNGRLHEARITVLDADAVMPRHLNKHIDQEARPVPAGVKEKSLATPLGMAISSDGTTLYVAAFGSSAIGVFDTVELEQNTFVPDAANRIPVSGGGPTGVVLDEASDRMYVLSRFDNAVKVIDLTTREELSTRSLHNPEPASVVAGRPFLYDANLTSSNGEASCAGCHPFGDVDGLAWDLGNPDGVVIPNPNPFTVYGSTDLTYHPMKGPMVTQSLRGMANHGPMHWRGDRTGGNFGANPLDEDLAFKSFNITFMSLHGREEGGLNPDQLQSFTDFVLQITYPPNPLRRLDNTLREDEQRGEDLYFEFPSCNGCHTLDPANGFFGANGLLSVGGETQDFKVPHLRNAYQKIGMFARPGLPFIVPGENPSIGPQVRGFGFQNDGSLGTVLFVTDRSSTAFSHGFQLPFPDPDQARDDLSALAMVFDSNLKPIVGQQLTLGPASSGEDTNARLMLMTDQVDRGNAELIAKYQLDGRNHGATYQDGFFIADSAGADSMTLAEMRTLALQTGQEVTFTAVPPGSGTRMGIDRDEDGVLDGDDLCPFVADESQSDADSDRIGDACDNCIEAGNPAQRDTNGDGFGNSCDADLNNDRIINYEDLGVMKMAFFTTGDVDADLDGDHSVNFSDLVIMKQMFFQPPGPSALN